MASPDDPGPVHVLNNQISRQRPGSRDDNSSTAATRAARNRAPRACVSCRDRKVRCDVVVSGGVPCTNCRLDDVDCLLKASNRGKRNSARRPARSRLPLGATAPRASSPFDTIHVHADADTAASESAPASGPATVHEAHREQQPQPRPTRDSTPSARPANPPTSDDLVALAFQGKTDANITLESCGV